MGRFAPYRFHELVRRQADALIFDVDAAVARPEGDLLGAIGMAVKPGLAVGRHRFSAQAHHFVALRIELDGL